MRRTTNRLDRAIETACRAFLRTVNPAAAHEAVAEGEKGLGALCNRRARRAAAKFEVALATRPEGPGGPPRSDVSVSRRFELAFHDAVSKRFRSLVARRLPPTPAHLDVGLSGTLEGNQGDPAPQCRRNSRTLQHVMSGTVSSVVGGYCDAFYLLDDRANSRWALWACVDPSEFASEDEGESAGGERTWSAVAWCPRGDLEDRLAAVYLMRAVLRERRDDWGNGPYAHAEGGHLLSDDEVAVLQDEVYEGCMKW